MPVNTTEDDSNKVDNQEQSNAGENNGKFKKHQHADPAELFDLTKPLKRVERPLKEEHEAELAKLTEEVDQLKIQRQAVQTKIDYVMDNNRNSEVSRERDALARLRSQKGALIGEKKAIRARLDATRNQSEKLFDNQKSARANIKFTKIEDIDAEIKKLQRRQETTSMSLSEEKKLIKEMDQLQASKKFVAQLKTQELDIEHVKEQRKLIATEIGAKDKEIDAVQADIEVKTNKIKSLSEKETDNREKIQSLLSERDNIRTKINDKLKEKDKSRQIYREANNGWYDYQRAIRAQRKLQQDEERRKKEEERLEWLKKQQEEELKKVPYEEEMALCDYLADYLTKTHLTDPLAASKKQDTSKKDDIIEVKDDPFAGFKPVNKKKDDEVYLKMGPGKKPRQRQSKKEKKSNKSTPFTLNLDTFEQFGLLKLTPPTSFEAVQSSVDELREKKKWYSQQERGSVPTAADIRKENERAAAQKKNKSSQNNSSEKNSNKSSKQFSTDDFVPLSSRTTPLPDTAFNSSWGKPVSGISPLGRSDDEMPLPGATSTEKNGVENVTSG